MQYQNVSQSTIAKVNTTVETLEGNKVKLTIEVSEQEFEKAIDAAFKKIAREVNIAGFRPGKAPRRVLETRVGKLAGRQQALQDALPEYYSQAAIEHDIDVIAPPEIDIKEGQEEGDLQFEAVVEVRPQIMVPGYENLTVRIDSPNPTDEEVDNHIESMRSKFAELSLVEREAKDGDYVTIDIEGSLDGEPLEGLTATGYLYEVGSERIVPEIDEQLRGAKTGDTLEFSAAHPNDEDQKLDFVVKVDEVKETVLPDLTDDWAKDASEFDSIASLRADAFDRLKNVKKFQSQMAFREKTGEALAELVSDEIPEALVNLEVQERLQDLMMRLQAQGMTLDDWVAMSGKSADEVVGELKDTALSAVKVDLALRAIAKSEAFECDDDDLEKEFEKVAERYSMKIAKVRKDFEKGGQISAIRADVAKRKAFEWLLEQVNIEDHEGVAISRDFLESNPVIPLEVENSNEPDTIDEASQEQSVDKSIDEGES